MKSIIEPYPDAVEGHTFNMADPIGAAFGARPASIEHTGADGLAYRLEWHGADGVLPAVFRVIPPWLQLWRMYCATINGPTFTGVGSVTDIEMARLMITTLPKTPGLNALKAAISGHLAGAQFDQCFETILGDVMTAGKGK